MIRVIAIPHNGKVDLWEIESFEDAAWKEGWSYEKFENREQFEREYLAMWDEEDDAEIIREKRAEAEKVGFPCVLIDHEDTDGTPPRFVAADKFNAEEEAEQWIVSDLYTAIVIRNIEDAREALKYRGHREDQVIPMVHEIIREMRREKAFHKKY